MRTRLARRLITLATGAVLALAPTAVLATTAVADTEPSPASQTPFHPRIGNAMGIVPAAGQPDVAVGKPVSAVYHGGQVMRPPVTVHTIFWAPPGYKFDGSPGTLAGAPVPGYEGIEQQFFTDVAHDSGTHSNIFSLLGQYPDLAGAGGYGISYDAATDSINDIDPYPGPKQRCSSPSGVGMCVTDRDVAHEVEKMIARHDPHGRGLHDVWYTFLPPGVDECDEVGVCGTNAFAGYHSLANLGHGAFIYVVVIDPIIEFTPPQGGDPLGNPIAESAIDTAAHELIESITNPVGVGWMDPNGEEVADKCENGPQIATPLGFSPNGSPFNQLINGHQYLIQGIWSNLTKGCEDRTTAKLSSVSLASVAMKQFSSSISGNIGTRRGGVHVTVLLARARTPVAGAQAVTRANGSWGPTALKAPGGSTVHAFGDDRDGILVAYGKGGPKADEIAPGSGGNPFTESGWTGWYDLDSGFHVGSHAVQVSPCTQVGVLLVRAGGHLAPPGVTNCEGETGVATLATRAIGLGTAISFSSEDNRAASSLNPLGALVKLTVTPGEPGSLGSLPNHQILLAPSGLPTCIGDLRLQRVVCDGLVPGERYTVIRARGGAKATAKADQSGVIFVGSLPGPERVRGGDVIVLRNSAGRSLTALHVAHLRVALTQNETVITSGTCEPGDYWGYPVLSPPTSPAVQTGGATGTGTICPISGKAAGLSATRMVQTDDRSGGFTITSVPFLSGLSPASDGTVYGGFTVLCQTYLPTSDNGTTAGGTPVALTITPFGSHQSVFHSANVNRKRGVRVGALPAGVYHAKWVVHDTNGDTRTYITRFAEQG